MCFLVSLGDGGSPRTITQHRVVGEGGPSERGKEVVSSPAEPSVVNSDQEKTRILNEEVAWERYCFRYWFIPSEFSDK